MSLGIAVLFTSNYSNARLFSNYSNSCYPANLSNPFNITTSFSNLGSTGDLVNLYWYKDPSTAANKNNLMYYNYNTGNYSNDVDLYSYNMGDLYNCSIPYYPWGTSAGYVVINVRYNFINVEKTSGNLGTDYTFWVWLENSKSYRKITTPWGGYTTTINGESVYFDEWFPRHGSIVFYSSETKHTIQFIGSKSLLDYIVYFDPSEEGQNLYVINNYLGKAWSLSDQNQDPRYYLFGLWDSDIDTLLGNLRNSFEYSYSLTGGGNFFFPATNGQKPLKISWDSHSINTNATEISALGRTISYLSDIELDLSGLPESSNNGSGSVSSGSAVDLDAVRNYEGCLKFNNNLLYLANNQNSCSQLIDYQCICTGSDCNCLSLSEYVGLQNFIKNYNGTGQYTGVLFGLSCSQWLDGAMRMYESLPDSYSSYILTSMSWSSNPSSINVQNMCGMYPDPSSEQSWTCKYLGIGCSDFSFGVSYDQVKSFVKPFWDESIGVLITSFDSGFNYFNIPNCSTDYYGKSYGRANTIFIVFVAFIVFQLYLFFKS